MGYQPAQYLSSGKYLTVLMHSQMSQGIVLEVVSDESCTQSAKVERGMERERQGEAEKLTYSSNCPCWMSSKYDICLATQRVYASPST